MGQYYKPVSIETKQWVSSHHFGSGLKLMEHSWLKNDMVNAVANLLREGNPWFKTSIVWAGDYGDENKFLTPEQIKEYKAVNPDYEANLYSYVGEYGSEVKPRNPRKIIGRWLINHTKKERVSLTGLPKDSDGWRIHPLPLLTCNGNGRGGGDYREDNDMVGAWAGDVISVQETIGLTPAADFTKVKPEFVER